jgi:hypothetical protein
MIRRGLIGDCTEFRWPVDNDGNVLTGDSAREWVAEQERVLTAQKQAREKANGTPHVSARIRR